MGRDAESSSIAEQSIEQTVLCTPMNTEFMSSWNNRGPLHLIGVHGYRDVTQTSKNCCILNFLRMGDISRRGSKLTYTVSQELQIHSTSRSTPIQMHFNQRNIPFIQLITHTNAYINFH